MRGDGETRVGPEELKPETLRESLEVGRAMARGVRKAQEENRRHGLPNVYVRDGHVVEEFPDGTARLAPDPTEVPPTPTELSRKP